MLLSQGKWTAEEEDKLKQLYAEKGGRWKELGASLGRLPEAVRDKYKSFRLGDAKKEGKWTPEEEGKLATLVQEYLDNRPVRRSLPGSSAQRPNTVYAVATMHLAFAVFSRRFHANLYADVPL